MTTDTLFVPDLKPALKHPTVFKKFDNLHPGEKFLLVNDHDPIPLFYELKAERGETFQWNKIENGPELWKVEITKNAESAAPKSITDQVSEAAGDVFELNVTLIQPRLKHPTIFQHFDELKAGEAFRILNDHDPKPLYYQMIAERGNIFSWTYLLKGPQWWRVEIKKNEAGQEVTIGEIAAKDLRKAEVFKKYGIDFCCGGKKSLKQVCEEKGIDINKVEQELESTTAVPATGMDFTKWDADFLADYIYNQHHKYYYAQEPTITGLMEKVAEHHGTNHPVLHEVQSLYKTLIQELNTHFMKEERVLFPFIKAVMEAKKTGNTESLQMQPSLTAPIQMMESDHEAAGDILEQIRKLTDNYMPPADACNSYQFLFKKLKELDEDLQQHIHLENNILFPKAIAEDKSLRK
jgi:regulator of cell morphogenesis and NO signaling